MGMLDVTGSPVKAAVATVVNLGTTSGGGIFLDASNNVITSVTIPAGAAAASAYYRDTLSGYPVITVASGFLASATQGETVLQTFFPVGLVLPGFFGGANLIVTNQPGLALGAWSSTDATLPVSNWQYEGELV
jgi:hypothetical protein